MSAETAFYIFGIALAVTAVLVSFVGLRFEKFPPSRGVLFAGIAVFVVLVGAATTYAWINAEDEQEIRDEEIAAGELPSPAEVMEEYAAGAQATQEADEGETAPAQEEETAAGTTEGANLFESEGCAGCHTLEAAGSTGTIGPDLDAELAGEDAAYIEESIVDPDAETAEGFNPGIMPTNFGDTLSPEEIQALVDYIAEAVGAQQ
jgi:mono/diheme cytochrome c family protein